MNLRACFLISLLLTGTFHLCAQELPKALSFTLISKWAGPDAQALGFTLEQLDAFLSARAASLDAANQPQWSSWLKKLEESKNPSLRAWALSRRVEAGDYSEYPALQQAVTDHLLGISKPMSGRKGQVIVNPPYVQGIQIPDALRIDHGIVLDWAMAWGSREDFALIRAALKDGEPKGAFDHATRPLPWC